MAPGPKIQNSLYEALLVDADIKVRNNLKQLAQAVSAFRKAHHAGSINEAQHFMAAPTPCDVMFISYKLGMDDIKSFIEVAKKTPKGEECAYIMILSADSQDERNIAQSVLIGCHGVLCEPYSVDRLHEIAEVAKKVKLECGDKRKRAAIQMLMSSILKEFDKLSLYIQRGFPADRAKKRFVESMKVLKEYQEHSFRLYIDIAIDCFEQAPAPAPEQNYKGGSDRVRKKLEQKLREQFEKECGAADGDSEVAKAPPRH